MKRQVSMEEISDGKKYGLDDLARADCQGCAGCSACCRGMGTSIVLDPLDVWRLKKERGSDFDGLLKESLELHMESGLILPNLRMNGPDERCAYLDKEGRCGIHGARPGICRLFPMGRAYENRTFYYFLQPHECKKKRRAKIRVRRLLEMDHLEEYEDFIKQWHYFLEDIGSAMKTLTDASLVRTLNMYILRQFYISPFDNGDFYQEVKARINEARERLLSDNSEE